MFSEEELKIVQDQLAQLNQRRENLKEQIKTRTEQVKSIPSYQNRLEELEKLNKKDEEVQMKELQSATSELNSVRSEFSKKKNNFDDSKIKKAEKSLASLVEKGKKIEDSLNDLRTIEKNNKSIEEPIDNEILFLLSRIQQLSKLSQQIPKFSKYLMSINDSNQSIALSQHKIQCFEEREIKINTSIDEKEGEKLSKLTELRKITTENNDLSEIIQQYEAEQIEIYKKLNSLSIKLQEVNDGLSRERITLTNTLSRVKSIDDTYTEKINDTQREIDLINIRIAEEPKHLKDQVEEVNIRISKTNQMKEQIEKKLEDLKKEIRERFSESNDVTTLTNMLAEEWVQHQIVLDHVSKSENTLGTIEADIDRKKFALSEITERFSNVTNNNQKGMFLLSYIYDTVLNDNRKLGEDLVSLQDDCKVLENDYELLKEFSNSYSHHNI